MAETQATERNSFRIRLLKPNPQPVPIRGAYGGPAPDGLVVVHLYSEYPTLPDQIDHPVDSGGIINMGEGQELKDSELTRIVQLTMSLSPSSARQLGKWLTLQADEAESRTRENLETELADDND